LPEANGLLFVFSSWRRLKNRKLYFHLFLNGDLNRLTLIGKNSSNACIGPGPSLRHPFARLKQEIGSRFLKSQTDLAPPLRRKSKMSKNKSVLGIDSNRSAVESAITAFRGSGFQSSDLSILLPDNLGNEELAAQKETKAPEGAAAGAGSGAVIGGALGWLVGIGALAIPGIGPFIAAGPIMSALAGMGVGGTLGGLTGALVGLGIPEYEANCYEGRLLKGGILVSVHCGSAQEIDSAKKIMERTDAEDVSATSEPAADLAAAAVATGRRRNL
jgi:hypothetical protein